MSSLLIVVIVVTDKYVSMMDNIIASKLYRPGSVGYVSKSGGMSNELNNILSLVTNGTYEGIAIGGDRYPGSTFIDHLLRYEQDPDCKMLVLLGEVGGIEEYRVIEAVKKGIIRKPIVAWAIGTCAKMFATEVQFGHAGSMANSDMETADAKNKAMKAAGFIVPDTFEELPQVLKESYELLVKNGTIKPKPDVEPPVIPMDYKWAQELGLIRKPAAFISTISDERGQELLYAGMTISDVFKDDIGIGGVVSLLWFKRRMYLAFHREFTLCLSSSCRFATLGHQIHRNGSHAYRRSRPCRIWCYEHHRRNACWQRLDLFFGVRSFNDWQPIRRCS
jgi:ATP citrate (pro-S)-lyase